MTDIYYWKDTINTDIEAVRAIINKAPSIPDALLQTAELDKADKKIRTIKSNTRSFKAEIRLLPNADDRTRHKRELSHYEETTAQLTAELRTMRNDGGRQQLFLGANATATGTDEMSPEANGDALLNDAGRLQDKTQQSLSNTKRMVAESKEVGMQTVEELQRQRAAIHNTDQIVMEMEGELKRADLLIKTFGKRMATDKLIQCFACVNILMIVGVVIYAVVKGGLNGDDKDNGVPENPVNATGNSAQTRMLRGALGW